MNNKNFDFSNNFIIEKDDNECYSFYYPFTRDNSYLGKNNMNGLNK